MRKAKLMIKDERSDLGAEGRSKWLKNIGIPFSRRARKPIRKQRVQKAIRLVITSFPGEASNVYTWRRHFCSFSSHWWYWSSAWSAGFTSTSNTRELRCTDSVPAGTASRTTARTRRPMAVTAYTRDCWPIRICSPRVSPGPWSRTRSTLIISSRRDSRLI